jgi:hypothetical protein
MMVAHVNRLEESQLEMFLFGADRTRTVKIRAGLWEIQGGCCFYCRGRIAEPARGQVDHFVPWSRYPDDNLDNFVVADNSCNRFKSNSLPAADYLSRWRLRFEKGSSDNSQFADLAQRATWDRRSDRSLNVVRAIYLRLPNDARLWLRGREFVPPDAAMIATILKSP